VRTQRPLDALALCKDYRAAGTREEVRLCILKKNIVQVETELVSSIRQQLKTKAGPS
jgi:gamma-glutamylcysteine synthetase